MITGAAGAVTPCVPKVRLLAVLTASGRVEMHNADTLQMVSPAFTTIPGATSLTFYSSLLLVADNSGKVHRGDGAGAMQVFDGDAITAIDVFGDNILVAAGRSLRRLQMIDSKLTPKTEGASFSGVVTGFVHCQNRSFAVTPGLVQLVTPTGKGLPEFQTAQTPAAATRSHVVAMGPAGIVFLNPLSLDIAGRADSPLKESFTAMAELPGENAVAITTDHGNVIICRAR